MRTEDDEEGIRRVNSSANHSPKVIRGRRTTERGKTAALLRAQRLSHQGVASQHEKPNEGAGFFFLSLSRSICSSIVGSYVNVSTTQHPEMRAKRSAVPIARIIISPFP